MKPSMGGNFNLGCMRLKGRKEKGSNQIATQMAPRMGLQMWPHTINERLTTLLAPNLIGV